MLIIHGEHTVKSRERLGAILQAAHAQNQDVVRLPAKELTPALVEETLVSTSLFGTEKLIVIEELHSLPKSAKKDALIEQLSDVGDTPIVLWEKRQLTPTMLKKFKNAATEEFKSSSVLFRWLDGFGSTANKTQQLKELQEIYNQDGAEFLFAMIARQVRLLISAKDDGQITGAPFMITKLKKQASAFTLEKLLAIHQNLLDIDHAQKTSGSRLTLQQQLDLLVLTL
jgi:hypothetical protein